MPNAINPAILAWQLTILQTFFAVGDMVRSTPNFRYLFFWPVQGIIRLDTQISDDAFDLGVTGKQLNIQ